MHHLPVQRKGPLGSADRELLELCAEGWSATVIAGVLDLAPSEVAGRLDALCELLGVALRPDGQPPVHAARLWLVAEARDGASAPQAA